jgi:ABC-type antimicrobial peptide transport system permease subunit
MYAKLSLRNARRSAGDYLLYIITLIVLSTLMMFSNVLAAVSSQHRLQAHSIPLLISLVMVSLLGYINRYMLRRRAKEFAAYILLGMKNSRIAIMFFAESLLLGSAGLTVGIITGGLIFLPALSFLHSWFPVLNNMLTAYGVAVRDTIFYFAAVQTASLLGCVRKIGKLQMSGLLSRGKKIR